MTAKIPASFQKVVNWVVRIPMYKLANSRQARKWPIGVVSSAHGARAADDVKAASG
jgi:hypothetical protein